MHTYLQNKEINQDSKLDDLNKNVIQIKNKNHNSKHANSFEYEEETKLSNQELQKLKKLQKSKLNLPFLNSD